jgi:hypothetical protein
LSARPGATPTRRVAAALLCSAQAGRLSTAGRRPNEGCRLARFAVAGLGWEAGQARGGEHARGRLPPPRPEELGTSAPPRLVDHSALLSCSAACSHCRCCRVGSSGQCLEGDGWIFGHLIGGAGQARACPARLPGGARPHRRRAASRAPVVAAREQEALTARFGLDGREPERLLNIVRALGVSVEETPARTADARPCGRDHAVTVRIHDREDRGGSCRYG